MVRSAPNVLSGELQTRLVEQRRSKLSNSSSNSNNENNNTNNKNINCTIHFLLPVCFLAYFRFLQGTRIRTLSPGHEGPVSGMVYVKEDKVR